MSQNEMEFFTPAEILGLLERLDSQLQHDDTSEDRGPATDFLLQCIHRWPGADRQATAALEFASRCVELRAMLRELELYAAYAVIREGGGLRPLVEMSTRPVL